MSEIQQLINNDFTEALKTGNADKVSVLRMVKAAITNKEIEKKGKGLASELSDEEMIELLSREAKKRKEAMELFEKGGRNDLMGKELYEFGILQQYLPAQLTEQEIEKIVDEAIKKIGASDIKDLGKIMGEVLKETKGRADGKTLSETVKKKLIG
ncbi:MAG: GatB/YqeY domain-containing protein [Patescibacteria group bacterium]|nr:GatB/YqeY domain-containing protein [Patescibacteria group bacterium]